MIARTRRYCCYYLVEELSYSHCYTLILQIYNRKSNVNKNRTIKTRRETISSSRTSISEQQSINKRVDETKNNIRRKTDEKEVYSRLYSDVNEYQEETLQADCR
jgi:DNA-binding transcriptional regulator GbsR (MarR family)